jgi:thiamine pyrophosphate-dependent acetolactate synthase large subunit-like protein
MHALNDEGVELIFGYPGGAALHIYDAIFRQDKIDHILVRHEQGATHAADGYARATGKPGVVLVTSGPGATNAITWYSNSVHGFNSNGCDIWSSRKSFNRHRCLPRNRYDWYF